LDKIAPFLALVPGIIVDGCRAGFETLQMEVLHRFSATIEFISDDPNYALDASVWESPAQCIFRLAEESPSLSVGEFTET
jgi:hypothetical protein